MVAALMLCAVVGVAGMPGGATALPAGDDLSPPATEELPPNTDDDTAPPEESLEETPDGASEPPPGPESAPGQPLTCEPGFVYSITQPGQMRLVAVGEDRESAVVTNVGGLATNKDYFDGLGVGPGGQVAYAVETRRSPSRTQLHRYDIATETWVNTGASAPAAGVTPRGGAVDPNGVYWYGAYLNNVYILWSYDAAENKITRRAGLTTPQPPGGSAGIVYHGDIAFDREGNLYLTRSVGNPAYEMFRVDMRGMLSTTSNDRIPVVKVPTGPTTLAGMSGIAFDSRGVIYISSQPGIEWLTQPQTARPGTVLTLDRPPLQSFDLGTCGFPPTVKVQTDLPNGRIAPSDQFELEAIADGTQLGKFTTTGNSPGVQEVAVGPVPVTSGFDVSFSQRPVGTTDPARYATGWECVLDGDTVASGVGASGAFTMPDMREGNEVLCTITNSIVQVSKASSPESGTQVQPGNTVEYRLEFDNSAGLAPVDIDYRDFLGDVLDDATFVDAQGAPATTPSVTTSGGIIADTAKDWDAGNQWLDVRGTVPAGEIGVLTLSVQVTVNRDGSGPGNTQFLLKNTLAQGSPTQAPSTCEAGMCTEHPVSGWSVTKESVPAAGVELQRGSVIHYRVAAEKDTPSSAIAGLELRDDLTQVLKSAGWAPNLPAPAGVQAAGIYLFNADGRTVGLDGAVNSNSASEQRAIRQVGTPELVNVAPDGDAPDERWLLSSGDPIDMPEAAVRAEMWFTVVVGESPAGIPAPDTWEGDDAQPATGWSLVNYATGMAKDRPGPDASAFAPNECATGVDVPDTSPAANAANPVDGNFPESCRTQHRVSENSFAIQKDAAGGGVAKLLGTAGWGGDPTGLANMVGQAFEVRDDIDGQPSDYPSVKLCRTDYDPYAAGTPWRGEWVAPAQAGDESRWAFGSEGTALQDKIRSFNNEHPRDPVPMCGTVIPDDTGENLGSWGSSGLPGGDYWLVETRAPNAQSNLAGTDTRPVAGVQLLAEPVPFRVGATGPGSGDETLPGAGQLDIGHAQGGLAERCDPAGTTIGDRATACVAPAGKLMLVKDAAQGSLPFTGGSGLALLGVIGGTLLVAAVVGGAWWRRRSLATVTLSPPRPPVHAA